MNTSQDISCFDGRTHDEETLALMQALPLEKKIMLTQTRIIDWYNHFNGRVYVAYSGGKDSTVLLHLVRELFPDVPAVYMDTGIEYPEVREMARKHNAVFLKPKMNFVQTITKYGYPLISKEVSSTIYYARRTYGKALDYHRNSLLYRKEYSQKNKYLPLAQIAPFRIHSYCCYIMKKSEAKKYEHATGRRKIVGTTTDESQRRKEAWIKTGCNSFDGEIGSKPISFWKEQDILKYIHDTGLEIASVYGDVVEEDGEYRCTGCKRTGCIFCPFGMQRETGIETRFQRLKRTHQKLYDYSLGGGEFIANPDYDPTLPDMDGEWKNWNPKKIWIPNKDGLGLRYVFDFMNRLYGAYFMRYEED